MDQEVGKGNQVGSNTDHKRTDRDTTDNNDKKPRLQIKDDSEPAVQAAKKALATTRTTSLHQGASASTAPLEHSSPVGTTDPSTTGVPQ
eukprot:16182583-Heterocapsa_arctica.AAC.1